MSATASTFADQSIQTRPAQTKWPTGHFLDWDTGSPQGLEIEDSPSPSGVAGMEGIEYGTQRPLYSAKGVIAGWPGPNVPRNEVATYSALSPILVFDVSSVWLGSLAKRLSEISVLENDWDGYGADRPSERAIRAAQDSLQALVEANLQPTSVDPSAEGGVCISFRKNGRYADIEFFNSGEVLAVTSTGHDDSKVWQVSEHGRSLPLAVEKIRRFINS